MAGVVREWAYSLGSRANRSPWALWPVPAAAGSTGCSRSRALASIEAIFATDTTSRSGDRSQAASNASGP